MDSIYSLYRVTPVTLANARIISEDVVLSGYHVPADVSVNTRNLFLFKTIYVVKIVCIKIFNLFCVAWTLHRDSISLM